MRLVTGNPDKDLFLNEFIWVSSNLEFWAGDDGLWSFPRFSDRLADSKYSSCQVCTLHVLQILFMLILIFVRAICTDFNDKFKRHSEQCKEAI